MKALWTKTRLGIKPNGWRPSRKPWKPLTRRSTSYSKRVRQYRKQAKDFLRRNTRCAVFPGQPATQIHHRHGRLGRLLLDERFWLAVSAEGHAWIHDHPAEARRRRLLAPKGDWNKASLGK